MQLTIRARLILLVALMLTLMLVLGLSGWQGLSVASRGLSSVVVTGQALRNHMEGDMMHDALRADVLAALLAETPGDAAQVASDTREHAQHFRDMIAANERIAQADTKAALAEVREALDHYIGDAETLVSTAQTDKAGAKKLLPQFLATFSALEDRLS